MADLKVVPKKKLTRAEEILSQIGQPGEFDFEESDVIRLMGGSAANGDKNDPVVFQGKAIAGIARMVEKYGLDRAPRTYGEYQGMSDYCAFLDIISGEGIVRENLRKHITPGGYKVWQESKSTEGFKPIAEWYCEGNIEKVRKYHIEHGLMTKLGQRYEEFSGE